MDQYANNQNDSSDSLVAYALKTATLSGTALVGEGTGWRFRFQTPISGLDVNKVYTSQDQAITALVHTIQNQFRELSKVA